MNPQADQYDSPFEDVLNALIDETSTIDSEMITRLSDLEGENVKKVRSIWRQISPERRLVMLEEMEALVDDNHLLSFESISKIAIDDEDPQVRFLAIRSLAIYETTELIPDLIQLIEDDSNLNVRAACAFTLGRFAYLAELDQLPAHYKEEIQACLFKVVNGEDEDIVRCQALESLGFITHTDLPALVREAVESDNIEWQASALSAMGRSCDSRWVQKIELMLEDSRPMLRLEAVRAAGELGASNTKTQLIELLEDGIPEIRLAAIWSLSQIGGEGVGEALKNLLNQTDDDDETDFIEDALDNLDSSDNFDLFGLLDFEDEADFYDED